jgi:signal transduction histidine kinase
MSARIDLVHAGARRVALVATAIVAGAYLLVAAAVVLIVSHNLTAGIDDLLLRSLSSMSSQPVGRPGGFHGPPGEPKFGAPVLWWKFHPDGNYADRSADAASVDLPVPYSNIKSPQTITVSGTDLRVAGGLVGDDWTVVGQTMATVYQSRWNLLLAEALIGPILLAIVFLGALAIGRRVATPVELARQRQMEFTANASHELRTPLSVIQAQATLALTQPREVDWYRHAFERIDEESKRMRRLVDNLLWLARFDAKPGGEKAEPVDVAVLACQTVDRFATIAETRRLRLTIRLAGESHVIAASPEWLDHLVGVLVDNACKYTPENGSVEVLVAAEGDRVRLAVDDSGPGIPPEQRGRIFDRFQRATDEPGGAGIGLAIADAVVRATSGRWEIGASRAGGASMAISWPRLMTPGGAGQAAVPASARPQLDS